jgi:uncharacterized short protein YbdD (DUF466 family)
MKTRGQGLDEARSTINDQRLTIAPSPSSGLWPLASGLVSGFRSFVRTLRTIIGVPDYERYVEHFRHCHPDRTPLTRDEFARDRMEARYSQPGNRCC